MLFQPMPLHHIASGMCQAFCFALGEGDVLVCLLEPRANIMSTTKCVIVLYTVLKVFTILAHSGHGRPLAAFCAVWLRVCGCGTCGGGVGGGGGCTRLFTLAVFAAKLTAIDKHAVAEYVTLHATARLGCSCCIVALTLVLPTNQLAKLHPALQGEDGCVVLRLRLAVYIR